MKRLLTTLVILAGLIGSAGAVWADDFDKGWAAEKAGDYAEAVKWYRKAAEQGDAWALFNLAFMHERGKGVTQDYAEAVKLYRRAAEHGVAQAQYNLGLMYVNGAGVNQGYAEAVKLYRRAAEQGLAQAQYNLGVMYVNGEGVLQDKITAHMWYNIAAANGDSSAVYPRDKVAKKLTAEQLKKIITNKRKGV